MIVAAVIVAVLVLGFGTQVLARYVQRFGTDLRSAGPLVELRRAEVPTIQPADMDRLEGMVADGLLSDSHLRRDLLPLLQDLAADATRGPVTIEAPSRLGRANWLARTLDDLEDGWGIER